MKHFVVDLSPEQYAVIQATAYRKYKLAESAAKDQPKLVKRAEYRVPADLMQILNANGDSNFSLILSRVHLKYLNNAFHEKLVTLMTRTIPEYEDRMKTKPDKYVKHLQNARKAAEILKTLINTTEEYL